MMRYWFLAVVLSVNAVAYEFPILQKSLGGRQDRKDGVEFLKRCDVFDTNSSVKKYDLTALFEKMKKAEKEKLNKAVHITKTVPTVEIWASYPQKFPAGPSKTAIKPIEVLLYRDSSALETRNGDEAAELIKIVDDICKDLN